MVTETSVIGMFLDSHDLNAVISVLSDTGKDIFAEFIIGAHFFCILRHADVAFVNHQRSDIGYKYFFLEFIGFGRFPYLSTENLSLLVLYDTVCPCRDTFSLSSFPVNFQFVELQVFYGFGGKGNFPVSAVAQTFQLECRFFFPVVEVTDQVNSCSVGRPFAENPSLSVRCRP